MRIETKPDERAIESKLLHIFAGNKDQLILRTAAQFLYYQHSQTFLTK